MINRAPSLNLQVQKNNRQLIQLILRAQQIAKQDPQQERGYAMVMVSILTVILFSLMSTYLTMTNLTKSSTNAYVDGSNTFYAAESGLNKRADELRQQFIGYSVPTGLSPGQVTKASPVSAANIANCFSMPLSTSSSNTANDFECRNYPFKYNNNSATVSGSGGTIQSKDINKQIDYTTFTFVADSTVYDPTSVVAAPLPVVIPAGQIYAGLNAQQYRYTVYSTAAKIDPADPVGSMQRGDARTVLQMEFKSQIIPLFQFASFYDRDLEINSSTPMTLTGRLHTNSNLYVQPTPLTPNAPGVTAIDFLSNVTVAGDIYNRVDAFPQSRYGTTRVLTGSSPSTYGDFPAYDASRTTKLSTSELALLMGRVKDGSGGVVPLSPPAPSFLRKRNYYNNEIGAYFGKADLRLQMTPNSPIPFKFTTIQSGVNAKGETCATTYTVGQDPPQNYIDPNRDGSNFKCHQLSLGEITSLQQPILVLTRGNTEEEAKFCATPTDGSTNRIRDILNYASVTTDPTVGGLSTIQIDKVLRALQVAISGYRQPLDYGTVSLAGSLPMELQSVFATLLADSTLNIGLNPTQIAAISTASPASIAKARNSCFLPASIQVVAQNQGYNGNTPPTQPVPYTPGTYTAPSPPPTLVSFLFDMMGGKSANAVTLNNNSSGLFDRPEDRFMQVLQTNIESLTVWNRDGRFVNNLSSTDLTVLADINDLRASLNSGDATILPTNPPAIDAFSGNGVLFVRAQPRSASSVGSFDHLGLSGADTTEGGLVFHAHVDDYLDGRTSGGASDVTIKSTDPDFTIYKLDQNYNKVLDATGQPIILDYYRLYPYSNGYKGHSPYAFAFNGGRNLPGSLTIASDQAIYLQGDYNTIVKKPAAIMADTISILSVNCLSPGTLADPSKIPTAEINCMIDYGRSGNSPWTTSSPISMAGVGNMYKAQTTSVNAAFLSFTPRSWGNLGVNRAGGPSFSGGLNNYMRFVEDWRGQALNYNGSLVSLGNPLEFNGWYQPGGYDWSYYSPPDRNFTYDTSFNAYPQLPPMTPSVIYLQQDAFRRK
jgi:Tfp pilus assembly protein PilX